METLVIYDSTGYILSQMRGDVREPEGIPFMWVEIPEGKRLTKIDTSKNPHKPVFEDIEPSDIDILKQRIAELESALVEQQDTNILLLEAMADVYEEVLPFLPTKR